MKRIYSSVTGAYLGLLWFDDEVWWTELRSTQTNWHLTEENAMAHLERQPEHQATAA